jgi:hypothetical protein
MIRALIASIFVVTIFAGSAGAQDCGPDKEGRFRLFVGCPFDAHAHLDHTGKRRSNFDIAEAPPRIGGLLLEEFNGRNVGRGFCAEPADRVFVAYSPYEDATLFFVRDGILIGWQHHIDRALAKDYLDAQKSWKAWRTGQAKGWLTCIERAR